MLKKVKINNNNTLIMIWFITIIIWVKVVLLLIMKMQDLNQICLKILRLLFKML